MIVPIGKSNILYWQANRNEEQKVDFTQAKEDAIELFDAGVNRFGTDESM